MNNIKSILTIALLLSAIVSYGQSGYFFRKPDSTKRVYDTVQSILLISDTILSHDPTASYRGFIVYKNEAYYEKGIPFLFFADYPQVEIYLRNDKKPLPPNYYVWQHIDQRQCILQPIKGL